MNYTSNSANYIAAIVIVIRDAQRPLENGDWREIERSKITAIFSVSGS
jgi:hypothetical protein